MSAKISIITVTFNCGNVLRDCIKSASSQDVDIEHILIDGGSTDETKNIIKEYNDYFSLVVSEPDMGIYDAMNKGIKLASGDVIGILNADDYYHSSDVLKKVQHTFDSSEVDACYGDLMYVDKHDCKKIIRYWRADTYIREKFFWGWMPPHPTFFVRRKVYEECGLFNLACGSAADYEIMLRILLKQKIQAAYIPEVLVNMRMGGASNNSIANRIRANQMDRLAWRLNGIKPYPWTLLLKPLRKVGQWFMKARKQALL